MKNNPIIQVSFKNKPDDIELYNWVIEKAERKGASAFIKDLLYEVMDKEKKNK